MHSCCQVLLLLSEGTAPSDSGTLLKSIIAVAGAMATVAAAWFGWPVFQLARLQKSLLRVVGTELFGHDTLKASTRYFVNPNCSSQDPANEDDLSNFSSITVEQPLLQVLHKYCKSNDANRHLFVLGGSGMGKTTAILNYYRKYRPRLLSRLGALKSSIAVIPLGIEEPDSHIAKVKNKANTILILDAFDEDAKAIDDYESRLKELTSSTRQFRRVIITCRSQFFPSEQEIPVATGGYDPAPRELGKSGDLQIKRVYVSPFTDKQISRYLWRRFGLLRFVRKRRVQQLVQRLPSLSMRPMILSYLPDLVAQDEETPIQATSIQLFEHIVQAWLQRESRWVDKSSLLSFSIQLAIHLTAQQIAAQSARAYRADIENLANSWNIDLDIWQLSGRSLLNRDAQGRYKFAHRTIMEYLFVCGYMRRLCPAEIIPAKGWSHQMRQFLLEAAAYEIKQTGKVIGRIPKDVLSNKRRLRSRPLQYLTRTRMRSECVANDVFDKTHNPRGNPGLRILDQRTIGGESVIIDHATSLMWFGGEAHRALRIESAEAKLGRVNRARGYAGFRDWRLPTIQEALSLVSAHECASGIGQPFGDWPAIITSDELQSGTPWYLSYVMRGGIPSGNMRNVFLVAVRAMNREDHKRFQLGDQ